MAITFTSPLWGPQLDTGSATLVATRVDTFADGMPITMPGTSQIGGDTGVASTTTRRQDVANNKGKRSDR